MPPKGPQPAPDPSRHPEILLFACVFEGGLVFVALALGWLVGIAPLETMRADLPAVFDGLVATAPMLALLWWGLTRPDGAVGQVTQQAAQMVSHYFGSTSIAGLLLVSLLAGLGEEALFRGLLQPLFGRIDPLVGLVLGSIAFGLAHAVTRTYAVIAGCIGLYLGSLQMIYDNLMVPAVAHAGYDFIALLWLRSRGPSV